MSCLYKGTWQSRENAGRLLRILNDIHYWGLVIHGQSVRDDVLRLSSAKGSRDSSSFLAEVPYRYLLRMAFQLHEARLSLGH